MGKLQGAGAALAIWLSCAPSAHAVFFSAQVPEPETISLLVVGAVVAGVGRYLVGRRRRRRD